MKTTPVLSGILWGFAIFAVYVIFYIIGIKAFASGSLNWISFLLGTFFLIYFPITKKKELGGFMSFGQVYGFSVVMILVYTVVSFVLNYIFFTFVDPDFMESMKEAVINKALEDGMERGATEEQMDPAMRMIEWTFSTLGQVVFTAVFAACWCIEALITSIIIRKNKPEFA